MGFLNSTTFRKDWNKYGGYLVDLWSFNSFQSSIEPTIWGWRKIA